MSRRVLLVCQRSNNVPFAFEAAVANGIALTVVSSPDEPAPTHMPGVDDAIVAPVFDDPDAAMAILADYAARVPVDGIVTQREEAIVFTAYAARHLGLPGISPDAARAARDKGEMRKRFRAAGLNTPFFTKIRGVADLARLGPVPYPVVAKPAPAFCSAGVTLCRSDEDLARAVAWIEDMNTREWTRFSQDSGEDFSGIVVEGFIDGPEYLADCFARDGDVHVLSVGYKGDPRGPYFEETVYRTPPVCEPALIDAIVAEAEGGMRALGLADGPGHVELRLDPQGRPHILEIGARIGGSGTSHVVVLYSTGIDFAGLQYDFVTAHPRLRPLPDRPTPTGAASNYIIPLGGSGELVRIDGLDALERHPDYRRMLRFVPDGTKIAPYPKFDGFLGFIIGQHENAEAAVAFHAHLDATVIPRWR